MRPGGGLLGGCRSPPPATGVCTPALHSTLCCSPEDEGLDPVGTGEGLLWGSGSGPLPPAPVGVLIVPTLQGPCGRSPKRRGSLRFLPPLSSKTVLSRSTNDFKTVTVCAHMTRWYFERLRFCCSVWGRGFRIDYRRKHRCKVLDMAFSDDSLDLHQNQRLQKQKLTNETASN